MFSARVALFATAAVLVSLLIARADDAASAGRLIEECPTLQCLGVRWHVAGDDNRRRSHVVSSAESVAGEFAC